MKKQLLKLVKTTTGFVVITLLFLMSSCEKDDTIASEWAEPWNEQINMGNFSVNSGVIPTNENRSSVDYIEDYVMQSALPQVDFELIGIQAWIPTENDLSIRISNAQVWMDRYNGRRTENFYHHGFSGHRKTLEYDGTTYYVYEIFGFYNESLEKIRPNNFASVTFKMNIDYDRDGIVVGSRKITLVVYKKN